MILLLVFLIPVCLTVMSVGGLVLYLHLEKKPSRAVRRAHEQSVIAKAETAVELERWKQDWIIEKRREGEPPQLPPGSQTVLPRD